MTPNFALALSFEGISLLRRMGPRWARLDEVSLDHDDLDSAVIALRDLAESLDPAGAQVALVIPNEQIRYLDQPDLGGDQATRDVAIRAALDGATPYQISELRWDHVVSGGRLMIAAVAQETLDEARAFAVEHGFTPVSYVAQAPEGAFDGAVFFGKAAGWTRAATRPARALEIVPATRAALEPLAEARPSGTEPAGPAAGAQNAAKAPEEPVEKASAPAPTPPAAPEPEAMPQPTKVGSDADVPVTPPAATDPPKPAPQPAAAQATAPPPKSPIEAAIAAHKAPAPDQEPAPDPVPQRRLGSPMAFSSIRAARGDGAASDRPAPGVALADGLKPRFTPVSDTRRTDAPEADVQPETKVQPAPNPQPEPETAVATSRADEPVDEAPFIEAFEDPLEFDFDAPEERSDPKPERRAFDAGAGASALLAEASAAADEAEGKLTAQPKPAHKPAPQPAPAAPATPAAKVSDKPLPPLPNTPKTSFAAPKAPSASALAQPQKAPPAAAAPELPPKTRKTAPLAKRSAELPPRPAGKLPPKGAIKPIPKAASRAAALAAVPVAPPDTEELLDAPVAARRALAKPAAKPAGPGRAGGANPLAKLAALRGPRAELPSGGAGVSGGAAAMALPSGGPSFNPTAERDRMTIFGARDRDEGGKSRVVGVMLVALLLLVLAGIAAWASVFLDNRLSGLFGRGDATPTAVASLPASDPAPQPDTGGGEDIIFETASPDVGGGGAVPFTLGTGVGTAPDESAAPAPTPEPDVQIAAFETKDDQLDNTVLPLAVPLSPRTLSPEEASASYAATGIWQRAPGAPMTPPADGVEDIYVASIDPNIQIFDAVALPDAARLEPGLPLADPGLPPPADLTFDFDERDLIRATPEGALSPDGLRIFTGRPPVIPPLRDQSGALSPADPGDADKGIILARLEAMPRIRPEPRPSDVIEQRERVQLGGISRAELARIRPAMRPLTVQEQAEIDTPDATEQAVTSSLVPVGRPRNMAAIVEQADVRPDPQPLQTAAVAPRTIQPNIPSSAGVARSATLENAINLNRINLIGVYGTPDNRRALVRLPNGKYEKVKIGDRLDGGRVSAIGDDDLRYQKNGRAVVLKMPRG